MNTHIECTSDSLDHNIQTHLLLDYDKYFKVKAITEKYIKCPLTQSIFIDPVITNTGITYEKNLIEKSINCGNLCHITGKIITSFIPNVLVKNLIEIYKYNSEDFYNKLLKIITCPINNLIFSDPVVCNTGITYEKNSIEKWLENNETCPINNVILISLTRDSILKKLIDEIGSNLTTYENWKRHYSIEYVFQTVNYGNTNQGSIYKLSKLIGKNFKSLNEIKKQKNINPHKLPITLTREMFELLFHQSRIFCFTYELDY